MLICNDEKDIELCKSCYGNNFFVLTREEIAALLDGKTLGDPNYDEYGTFIKMETYE